MAYKTACIRALYDKAYQMCSNNNIFHKQVARIKMVMSSNVYTRYVRHKIIKRFENKKKTKNTDTLGKENIAIIFCRIPYGRVQAEKPIKNLVKKLKRDINELFRLRNIYRTKKLSYYCNTKDKCQNI